MDSAGDVRWGIVGPGRIAAKVVEDFAYAPGAVAVAAASRSIERAQAFCQEHGLATAYGSYGDIIAALQRGDDDVHVRSRVTYQDGSSVERELTLRIFDLTTYSIPEGRGRRPVWSGRR